jgi:KaiC/GvpD/RAD55 family RecA-like ATPase
VQSTVSGFQIQIPGLTDHFFPAGTTVLLTGRPKVGKSMFAEQFLLEGLRAGQHGIYVVTDRSPESVQRKVAAITTNAQLQIINLFIEKPRLINDISITVHQAVAKLAGQPVRVVVDSLSTLGMMLNPEVLPPWLLDQRARFTRNSSNVLALMVYDTGIHPPTIMRSLQVLTDVVLEMRLEDAEGGPKRLFRVFSATEVPINPRWLSFAIEDSGLRFLETAG